MRAELLALVVVMAMGRPAHAQDAPLPSSSLDVRGADGRWHALWRSDSAPLAWTGAPLARMVRWQAAARGVSWGDVSISGSSEAWRTRLVVARVNTGMVRLALDTDFTDGHSPAFTLARAPSRAILAVNAGQFEATMPWGWVVIDGRRWLTPQTGPLSAALAQDSAGALHWIAGADVFRVAASLHPVWAFQSYPAVILDDSVLPPIRAAGRGVDVAHRDARAGICLTRENELLVAVTRFDAAGPSLGFVPFGLTVPEMTAVLGALGCRDAMLLDGGISAKLRVRDAHGVNHDWDGLRAVPLALLAYPPHIPASAH